MRSDDPRQSVWLRRLPAATNVLGEPLIEPEPARRIPGAIRARMTPRFIEYLATVDPLAAEGVVVDELRWISPERWKLAESTGAAPRVLLQSTDQLVLEELSLQSLLPHADDIN